LKLNAEPYLNPKKQQDMFSGKQVMIRAEHRRTIYTRKLWWWTWLCLW